MDPNIVKQQITDPYVYHYLLTTGRVNTANTMVTETNAGLSVPLDDGVLCVAWPRRYTIMYSEDRTVVVIMDPYVYHFLLNTGRHTTANAFVKEPSVDPLVPIVSDDGVLTVTWPQTGQSAAHSATQTNVFTEITPPSFGSYPMLPHVSPPVQSFTSNTTLLRGNIPQNATQNMVPYSTQSYRPNTTVPGLSSPFMPPYIHESMPFGSNSAMPCFDPYAGKPDVSRLMQPRTPISIPKWRYIPHYVSTPISMPTWRNIPHYVSPPTMPTWRNIPPYVRPVPQRPTNVSGMLGQDQFFSLSTDFPPDLHFPTGSNARLMQEQQDLNLLGKRMCEEGQHSTQSRLSMQQNFQVPRARVARDYKHDINLGGNMQMQPSSSAPTEASLPNQSVLPTQQILNSSQPQMARGRGTNMGRNMCYRHYSDSIGSSSSNPKNSDAGNPKKSSS